MKTQKARGVRDEKQGYDEMYTVKPWCLKCTPPPLKSPVFFSRLNPSLPAHCCRHNHRKPERLATVTTKAGRNSREAWQETFIMQPYCYPAIKRLKSTPPRVPAVKTCSSCSPGRNPHRLSPHSASGPGIDRPRKACHPSRSSQSLSAAPFQHQSN